MFRREDYWPYILGVFVFAGLIAIPVIWGQFTDLPYDRRLALGLVGCMVFAYAHTRLGKFSVGRFFMASAFVFLVSLRAALGSGRLESSVVIPTGLLGLLTMWGCGWLGIGIARVLGFTQRLQTDDPNILTMHGTAGASKERDPGYSFNDEVWKQLIERTQEAWRAGELSYLSTEIQKDATGKSIDEFARLFTPALNALAFAFGHSPPDPDEYLICAQETSARLSFVLTNKYFYFFGLDQGVFANKYDSGTVALSDIRRCTLKEEGVLNRAVITLKSSWKDIYLRDLMTPEPVRCIMKMAEAQRVSPNPAASADQKAPLSGR